MGKLIPLIFCATLFAGEDSVLSAIRADAIKKGIPESYLNEAFAHEGIIVHDKILDRFARPYEKKSWTDYRKLFVTDSRINKGTSFYGKNKSALQSVEKQIGVDLFLILSIVGVESNYGRHRGEFTVFNALYTQIAKMPRRTKWAKKEMVEYLVYCYTDSIPPHSIKGSYAGAFGYGQFIPSSFNAYAADGNGDGVRMPYEWVDVFASVGNYLLKNGYPVSNPANEKQVYKSVYAYNHADNYVKAVLELRDELKKSILID
ncbi:MAG: lytic murein transglycosylase [Candidatus Marinimicrobia bacterium]|jgi:membrane-bound lytic murein transglycosylase B|nr:lytic murein transglycosylase [Candidatus Neomarinimicrobiota bacterium]MBT3676817.1 lytic murein transglycosylase [Candidatus Neomarinimicrobiota bacterium]MBT3762717.1 lytic murein transglycosylase [Candidatus Neomarinimicrobiota bacterium]MBT4068694.1 lytic murein transglycosylase [Candidatus Neomarinimicrobiota bacterium]MBT4271352.1 lytic murein transglycosylase [Candidatus Neomarinimicrobiota bacterium]